MHGLDHIIQAIGLACRLEDLAKGPLPELAAEDEVGLRHVFSGYGSRHGGPGERWQPPLRADFLLRPRPDSNPGALGRKHLPSER